MGILLFAASMQISAKENYVNNAIIPVQKLENDFYNWHQRHKQILDHIHKKKVNIIFIGDSITHMFGGQPKSSIARGTDTWNRYYADRNTLNMGFGWDRTQNVIWRLTNGELDGIKPKAAVILIGTNNLSATKHARSNTPAEIAEGVNSICNIIHKKSPTTHIILLGVLPRNPAHFREPIQEINRILAAFDKKDYISFLNMHDQFANADGSPKKELMHDNVHPNADGYRVWAETMEPTLKRLLSASLPATGKPGDAGI